MPENNAYTYTPKSNEHIHILILHMSVAKRLKSKQELTLFGKGWQSLSHTSFPEKAPCFGTPELNTGHTLALS